MPGDQHIVGVGLGAPGRYGAHSALGNQLHANSRPRAHRSEVMDQLRQILDGVDVVMWWRRYGLDAGNGRSEPGDQVGDLVRGQLPALSRLGSLHDLDL